MKKIIIISLTISFLFNSCTKTDFDKVPEYTPNLENFEAISIDSLKSMYKGSAFQIKDDIIIKGIVTSSDEAENFYKELFFEDETGGICLRVDGKSLYNKFPPGQSIYIKCKGLYMNDYKGVMQIGFGAEVNRLPGKFMDDEKIPDIISGGQPVSPKVCKISELNDKDVCRLIQLENVQFKSSELSKTYYNKSDGGGSDRILEDCEGKSIIVRTGSYAKFAEEKLPQGNGTIIALLQKYRDDFQLKIVKTEDVQLMGERCSK